MPLKPIVDGLLQCCRCKQFKPATAEHFQPVARTTSGFQTTCRVCKNWRTRERRLLALYGITLQDYDALMAKQKSRCAICRQKASGNVTTTFCHNCNAALGNLREDPKLVQKALDYLLAA